MVKFLGIWMMAFLAVSAWSVPAVAQDRDLCTAQCGGRPGGEAANTPEVVACFRKCMGTSGSSDGVSKKRPTK